MKDSRERLVDAAFRVIEKEAEAAMGTPRSISEKVRATLQESSPRERLRALLQGGKQRDADG